MFKYISTYLYVTLMDHQGYCDHLNCTHTTNTSVCQTLSEMDWERGLWNAALGGDTERVQFLINKSENAKEAVNATDNSGYTALHYAARNGHVDICRILLSYGANIDAQTNGRATALHKAAAAGKLDSVRFLIQTGANVEIKDIDGETVLHKAALNKRMEVFNFLIETFPQLADVKDCKGKSAAIK